MGQVKQLDQRMNAAGYLRLMPEEAYCMNMSNTLTGTRADKPVRESNSDLAKKSGPAKTTGAKKAILDFPPFKRLLLSFYDQVFRWYYDR